MAYTAWRVGDRIKLCCKVEDFCGTEVQGLYLYSNADIQKTEGCVLNCLRENCAYGCINTANREVVVKSVQDYYSAENDVNCANISAEKIYRTLGSTRSDSRGVAAFYYTVTEQDRLDYLDAVAAGRTYDIVFCINDPLARVPGAHAKTFEGITIEQALEPTYAIEFKTFVSTPGIIDILRNYTDMLTSGINAFIPREAGWRVERTEIDRGIIRLYLSESGSWAVKEVAFAVMGIIVLVIGAIVLALFGFTPVGIILAVASLVIVSFDIIYLATKVIELRQALENIMVKNQNDTALDQMVANVLREYDESEKTKDDCLNKLNGLKISYREYFKTKQKEFPLLYLPAINRAFESSADSAIEQFKNGTMTCEQATEKILTEGAIAKADVSTSFTNIYVENNPYVPPPEKEKCWIEKPIGEGCILSASTGQWIVGTFIALTGLGVAYWAVTRKPKETKIFIEKAKAAVTGEAERARAAYRTLRAPAVPQITGAPQP